MLQSYEESHFLSIYTVSNAKITIKSVYKLKRRQRAVLSGGLRAGFSLRMERRQWKSLRRVAPPPPLWLEEKLYVAYRTCPISYIGFCAVWCRGMIIFFFFSEIARWFCIHRVGPFTNRISVITWLHGITVLLMSFYFEGFVCIICYTFVFM